MKSIHGVAAMSVEQFARWAGIGRTTAWALIKERRLKAIKVGRRTLVRIEDAEHWLLDCPAVELKVR